MTRANEFDPIFHPRSIAIIGASNDTAKFGGRSYLTLKARRFPGGLFAVNPSVTEIDGDKAYARVQDIPESVDMAIRTREFLGTFMEHCHNTQHEDHAMLLRWDIEHPGQVRVMPTPMPTWDGVGYVPTYALPTFRSGDLAAAQAAAQNPDFGRLGE